MDVTGEGQRDRPALRVDRFSDVVCVLRFMIGPAGGRIPARIVGSGAASALIWQPERTRASTIASGPARCAVLEAAMGPTPFLLMCQTGQTKPRCGYVQGRWTGDENTPSGSCAKRPRKA